MARVGKVADLFYVCSKSRRVKLEKAVYMDHVAAIRKLQGATLKVMVMQEDGERTDLHPWGWSCSMRVAFGAGLTNEARAADADERSAQI